jgi:hypothetical protein
LWRNLGTGVTHDGGRISETYATVPRKMWDIWELGKLLLLPWRAALGEYEPYWSDVMGGFSSHRRVFLFRGCVQGVYIRFEGSPASPLEE